MSPSRSASAGSGRAGGGRAVLTALIVVGVAVGMLLLIRSRPGVEAFDPRSDAPDGASAAVLLLQKYGATVMITSQPPSAADASRGERVLVIADRLSAEQRSSLLAFVGAGGIAIVADPASTLPGGAGVAGGATEVTQSPPGSFTGGRPGASDEANVSKGDCTIGALVDLRGIFTPKGLLFPTTSEAGHCFSVGGRSFVIERSYGTGTIVGFGDNRIVTNAYLRYADNSGLLTSLLASHDGSVVRIMLGTGAKPSVKDIGHGSETLADIVSPGVWMGLTQLALAFIVFGIARGVRPGRAVREPQPTPIAGNELVLATGNLMQRAHHFDRAGRLIRVDFSRELCMHYRVPPGTAVDALARVAAQRSRADQSQLYNTLSREVSDGPGLVRLRDDIDELRRRTISDDLPERTPEPA
jgi:hypothetical protein